VIRLTVPSIEEDELVAMREVLLSGYLVQGANVAAFEEAVANYVGAQEAIAVSSCTSALHLSLMALGVHPGDLVIVTAYSWVATANVIELCGARPVFVDIEPETFNLDPNRLEEVLKQLMSDSEVGNRVKAVLPVHTFGQMADMAAIYDLASRYGLPVVEDAACALGATFNSRQAGTWGILGCFSFHPRKAITTGEGGIVVTDDANLVSRLRALRNHGQDPESTSKPEFIMPGFNCRMTEFQAALGLTQMRKIDRIIASRRRLAARYDKLLRGTTMLAPAVVPGSRPVYQSYVVLLPERAAAHRTEMITRLKEQGVETTIGTCHMPLTKYYRSRYGFEKGDFPLTDDVFARSLTLPMYEKMVPSQQEVVVGAVEDFLHQKGIDS
jgi:dTDP-4-amino-4,6-dideoxygalactose transaminase